MDSSVSDRSIQIFRLHLKWTCWFNVITFQSNCKAITCANNVFNMKITSKPTVEHTSSLANLNIRAVLSTDKL